MDTPVPNTIGIWHHATRRTQFCLRVEDLGVKYYTQEGVIHLLDSLKKITHILWIDKANISVD